MFVTVAAGPLTQVSRAMSNASFERPPTMRHPALLIHSCKPFELSVLFSHRRDFQFPLLSRWSALVVPPHLAPTRLGYGNVLLIPHRALRQSPSTLSRPLAHVVSPPSPCLLPLPPLHSSTQLHLSLLPRRFVLLLMRQEDVHPASRTKTKLTVVSSCTPPNRCLKRRQRRAVQAVCCRRPGISDFPTRIAPDV